MILEDQTKNKQVGMIVIVAIVIGFMSTILTIPLAQAQSTPPGALGSQLSSLTDAWWKWVFSIDTSAQPNPFTIFYQGDCRQLIQGNVMFLVGQGPAGSITNHGTCIVSHQTRILFPLVNAFNIDCTTQQARSAHYPDIPGVLCLYNVQHPARGQPFQQLMDNGFIASINQATNLAASIDGFGLQPVRVQPPPGGFEVILAKNDVFGFSAALPQLNDVQGALALHGAADGYWVLLPPLSTGQHLLTFGGCLPPDFGGCQTNTYTLVVQ